MKYAADFREIARNALRGKWKIAVLTGFLASLMGGTLISGGGSSGSSSGSNDSTGNIIQELQATDFWLHFHTILLAAVVILLVWILVTIVISGAAKLGYAIFNLNLIDNKNASVSDLFSQFHRLGDGFCMNFLIGLFTFLWGLLFVIPGIIKGYSYAMTPYIFAENPGMTATEAITESRRVMNGNKWRLFCLGFSFIGWSLLCSAPSLIALAILGANAVTTGNIAVLLWIIPCSIPTFIGSLFLIPYQQAAYAAFYRDVAAAHNCNSGEHIYTTSTDAVI